MNQKDRDRMARLLQAHAQFPMVRLPAVADDVADWIDELREHRRLVHNAITYVAAGSNDEAEEALTELETYVLRIRFRHRVGG